MKRCYVHIGHLTRDQMAFFGYTVIAEDQDFVIYRHFTGDDHIVLKSDPHLYVDDINDAVAMSSNKVINIL